MCRNTEGRLICPLHLEEGKTKNTLKILLDGEVSQTIYYYDHQGFRDLDKIASAPSTLVYSARWKGASKFAIKKFIGDSSKDSIVNEVNSHPNIIQFYGLTKFQDENYSLVLEYAEGGTLGKYLRNDSISFEWESQLKFAKEIASAISWLHDDVGIIHGDLHSNNILIHKESIKLADFGRSCIKGSNYNTEVWGVIPYVDSKMLEMLIQKKPCVLTEKSDIYSLGVLFWELTSRKSPFGFEEKSQKHDCSLINIISKSAREGPIKDTNDKFVVLYEKCWQHEPDNRPNINEVILELNLINPENKDVSTIPPEENEENGKTESLCLPD
uniref:Protein kinase domain-containing protein n=1 Tax=Rhizophagus irregularis (strain DAOM 181602 / DAOM 197198 / MUCL 43194) TaxID=747089 RepID=U9UJ10_RHIID